MTDCAHPDYREGAEAVSLTFMRLPAHTGRRGNTEADTDDSLPAHPGRRGGTEGDTDDRLPPYPGYRGLLRLTLVTDCA